MGPGEKEARTQLERVKAYLDCLEAAMEFEDGSPGQMSLLMEMQGLWDEMTPTERAIVSENDPQAGV